jgi:hypothetical protein
VNGTLGLLQVFTLTLNASNGGLRMGAAHRSVFADHIGRRVD